VIIESRIPFVDDANCEQRMPSGGVRTTASVARLPSAPGRFSITNG
jgi:hypothetical protein